MENKIEFLVSYDFGKAGMWAVMKAHSAEEITAKYPELEVVKALPSYSVFDIDESPCGWLEEVVRDRKAS